MSFIGPYLAQQRFRRQAANMGLAPLPEPNKEHEADTMKLPKPATVRKAIAAAIGGLGEIVALGLLHGAALGTVQAIIAGATVYGVYAVPNRP